MKKKTFVYDTSKGFSSLIKHYFSGNMDIHVCTSKKKIKVVNMSDYDVCFFAVNDIEDFLLLRTIYCEIEHFFISVSKKTIFDKMLNLNFDEAVLLDFDFNKKNIIDQINLKLKV